MNFISEDFHLHYISNYTLFIQSDLKSDYLLVVNEANEVVVFLHYDNLQPSIDATRILSLPFRNVLIGMPHQNLVWVPSEVFEESDIHLYSPYFLNNKTIHSKSVESLDAMALYEYDPLLENRWLNIFPDAKLVPNFEVFIQQIIEYISVDEETLAIHLSADQIDVVLFVNGEFKLYNTFEATTADDISYYILSIMRNFSLTGKFKRIILSGLDENSEIAIRIKDYGVDLLAIKAKNIWGPSNSELRGFYQSLNLLADTVLCE